MPYEYRKMTPLEREQILHQRRERGYPLHAPPHPFREAGRYLLTAANFEHAMIMSAPDRRTDFEARLVESMHNLTADVYGWVVLPNHYHILVGLESLEPASAAIKHLHGVTSREWNLAEGLTGKRRVWYKFSDRVIRDDVHFYRALNYIHYNAVKHRCADDPYEWPWSSLCNYHESNGREWLRDKWRAFPPGDFGRGWDD